MQSTTLTNLLRKSLTDQMCQPNLTDQKRIELLSDAGLLEAAMRQQFPPVELNILGTAAETVLKTLSGFTDDQQAALMAVVLFDFKGSTVVDREPQPTSPSSRRARAEDDGVFPN
jgi:hypothetical protein